MIVLYNLGIRIYYLLVLLISLWNEKARQWVAGQKNWEVGMQGKFDRNDRVIWFHCASLGEFEQGRPVMEKVRKEYPEYKILLTFFSPSGYEKRKDYKGVDHVSYLPQDSYRNTRKLLELVPVEKVIFIKYEFWYHFLRILHAKGTPVYLASGIFRKDQVFFKWYGKWYRKFLGFFTYMFVQNEESENLLSGIGVSNVTIAGDTRLERVAKIAREAVPRDDLKLFSKEKPVIVAGSTWEKDERLLYKIRQQLGDQFRWIIAPHEPDEKNIQRLIKQFNNSQLFSAILKGDEISAEVILVDTIGHLSSLYQYGTAAYIGGGFGKGIHNILEAAAFGLPLFFGPKYHSFQEAKDLVLSGVAYVVKHPKDGFHSVKDIVNNETHLKNISQIAENYVVAKSGAADIIVNYVFKKPS